MNVTRVLSLLRRYIGETDLAISDYADSELLEYIRDGQELMQLRGSGLVGDIVVDPTLETIVPEPSTDQGHLLALKGAILALTDDYNAKLSRGEIGGSWKSGLEEESTISMAKGWEQSIQGLVDQLEQLILIKRAPTTGTRPQ